MHEASLAGGVLQLVEDAARREGFTRLISLRLEAGELAGVDVRALRFALESLAPGTLLAAYRHGTATEHARMATQWQAGQLAAWQQAHLDAQARITASSAAATRAQRQRDQLSRRLRAVAALPRGG